MRLRSIVATPHAIALARPYAIASGTTAAVELLVVRAEGDDGVVGLGAATPAPGVTGESFAVCREALAEERTAALVGAGLDRFAALASRIASDWPATPAAAASLDMALHDLRARSLGLPLVEQPCPPAADDELRAIPAAQRRALVADESCLSPRDALRLAAGEPLYGGLVVKLMKCAGITPALHIAAIASAAGIDLMWGCMDESAIGIAAALHTAYAAPATRWLDLDGSFDLARDPGRGGFALRDGVLDLVAGPGLGVELAE